MGNAPIDRPASTAEDWTIPQGWDRYTAAEHAMWDRLFDRQAKLLLGRVAPEFMDGLDVLRDIEQGSYLVRIRSIDGWLSRSKQRFVSSPSPLHSNLSKD